MMYTATMPTDSHVYRTVIYSAGEWDWLNAKNQRTRTPTPPSPPFYLFINYKGREHSKANVVWNSVHMSL